MSIVPKCSTDAVLMLPCVILTMSLVSKCSTDAILMLPCVILTMSIVSKCSTDAILMLPCVILTMSIVSKCYTDTVLMLSCAILTCTNAIQIVVMFYVYRTMLPRKPVIWHGHGMPQNPFSVHLKSWKMGMSSSELWTDHFTSLTLVEIRYVCVYIHVHACMCVFIYMCMHACVCVHTSTLEQHISYICAHLCVGNFCGLQ